MAFVVENGTGLPTATAFISTAEMDAYIAAYTVSGTSAAWIALDTNGKQRYIMLASQYLVMKYDGRWKGELLNQDQGLPWPRQGAYNGEDVLVDYNVIPQEVKDACAELVLRVLSSGDLMPDPVAVNQNVQSVTKKVGPIMKSVTYSSSGMATTTWFKKVDFMLRGLLNGGGQPQLIRK